MRCRAARVERVIGTLRRELLDRILVLNERHLDLVLREDVRHDNGHRPHQSRRQRPRTRRPWTRCSSARCLTGRTDLLSPRWPPTAPSCWAMTRSRRARPRYGSGTAHRRASPRCIRRISSDWCSPGWTVRRGGVSASASSRCRRWSCTAEGTRSSRSATVRRSPARSRGAAARPRQHGHRPAGHRGRRGRRRDADSLTPPPDRPAAVGTLGLADLDVDNEADEHVGGMTWTLHASPRS
jgi:hypothetical protein